MILLDTQSVVWLTTDRGHLSTAANECIRKARRSGSGVAIASSSLWEIAMNVGRGGIQVPATVLDYLQGLEKTFIVLPITGLIADRSMRFSENYPRDPTDRMIGATALVHNVPLVTADRKIRASGEVNCVW
jgi:PIN domain nuclease of toxin-antitoxin system